MIIGGRSRREQALLACGAQRPLEEEGTAVGEGPGTERSAQCQKDFQQWEVRSQEAGRL